MEAIAKTINEVYEWYHREAVDFAKAHTSQTVLKTDCHNESGIFPESFPVVPDMAKHCHHVQCIEIEEDTINKAMFKIGEDNRWTITKGDIRELPFDDNTFDGIIDLSTIDHVLPTELYAVLEEYRRVCKDGADYLIVVWVHAGVSSWCQCAKQAVIQLTKMIEALSAVSEVKSSEIVYQVDDTLCSFRGVFK